MSARREKRREPNGAERWIWIVDVSFLHPDGRVERLRKVPPVQTKRGAELFEQKLRTEVSNGTYKRKEEQKIVPTLNDFAEEFVSTYAVTNNKPSEVETKRSVLKHHLLPAFGQFRLDQIGKKSIDSFKAQKLKDEYSPKSINNYLTILRKLLAVAVDWGNLQHVPTFKWLKLPPQEFDFLDFPEANRLMVSAVPNWRPIIGVAINTGLRLGELLALRWNDIDLVAGRIVVRRAVSRGKIGTPKNGRSREVPLNDTVLLLLREHRHVRGELVFCREDGSMHSKGATKWPLWTSCKQAGLRRIGWHVLRHTFASHLVMRGASIKAVQELMGHSDLEMTMRYAHLSPGVRRDAVRLLDGNLMATAILDLPKASNS